MFNTLAPLISIITVNLNNLSGLIKTMDSVKNQIFSNYEFIIIDGGSSDGSREYLELNSNKINFWVSEKDKGVYDAMNKGILISKGQYLLFLNSGDFLVDNNVLEEVYNAGMNADIIYGNVILDYMGNQFLNTYPDELTFEHFITKELPHQATFILKELFHRHGFYDTNFKIVADWNFFILCILKYNCSYKHILTYVSICDRGGISCDPKNFSQIASDRKKILSEHFSPFMIDYNNLQNFRREFTILKEELSVIKNDKFYKIYKKINNLLKLLLNY